MDSQDKDLKVFEKICEIVSSDDFNSAQSSFYEKNCQQFSDDEENKLEYKTIYEEYVYLVEQGLEGELKVAGYDEDAINKFYESFKENMKKFEDINRDVMDLLFGMIDFQKFKDTMIQYKKGLINDTDLKPDQELIKLENTNTLDTFLEKYN